MNELELGTKELDCLSNDKVYWPEDNKCYDLLSSGPCSRYTGCPWSLIQAYRVSLVSGLVPGCHWSKYRLRVFLVQVQGVLGPGTGLSLVPGPCTLHRVSLVSGPGTGCPYSRFRVSLVQVQPQGVPCP